jgi:hypothetical protein
MKGIWQPGRSLHTRMSGECSVMCGFPGKNCDILTLLILLFLHEKTYIL